MEELLIEMLRKTRSKNMRELLLQIYITSALTAERKWMR